VAGATELVCCFRIPEIGIAVERSRIPELWGEPVVLIDSDRVIACVSPECAVHGVAAGQKLSGAASLCPGLRALPYDRVAYAGAAEQVWDVLALESSTVEPVSPELCFLAIDHTLIDPLERMRDICSRLASALRIPVHAAIAPSKFAAEYAAYRLASGKRGAGGADCWVAHIPPDKTASLVASYPIARIASVDPNQRDRLARIGIIKLGDIERARIPIHRVTRNLREALHALTLLAHGIDQDSVKPLWPPPSIARSIDFETIGAEGGAAVTTVEPLHAALEQFAAEIADELVKRSSYCRTMRLCVHFGDSGARESEEKLVSPMRDADLLASAALRLLGRIGAEQSVVSLALHAGGLTGGGSVQLSLLDPRADHGGLYPHERERAIEAATAYIRKRWGPGALLPAALLNRARKIRLWTYPLGTLLNEEIDVDCASGGTPRCYRRNVRRRGRANRIVRVHDRWKEREWFWGAVFEHAVFRVESDTDGIVELRRTGHRWTITANAD
jgi:DNA polymerase-4